MPDQKRPNVLFLFTDQQRPDFVGMDPDVPVETPNVERLADRGVWFRDAVCPSPVCNPSRACIASGMEYDRCGVPGNDVDYPVGQGTHYERLRASGYHVMGCGKFDLASDFPLDVDGATGVERYGFSEARFNPAKNNTVRRVGADPNGEPRDPYTAYLAEHDLLETHVADYAERYEGRGWAEVLDWTAAFPTDLPQHAYYDDWITRTGLDLLEGAPEERPWYLEVNFQNPHHPWDITEEMYDWYRDPPVEFPDPVDSDLPVAPETHQAVRRNYAAMVEHLDRCVGRFLDALAERGELEETLVVFASDHGEMLGDHGQWQKLSPLRASLGVPLVAAGPGVADQAPRDDPVTLLDLHATFLEYAGLDAGGVDSRSMRDCLAGGEAPREVVYSGLSSWRLVYDGRHKLIEGYEPAHRQGAEYEPMAVGPSIARRRQAERERILHEVPGSETENLAAERPGVVADLHETLVAIRDGERRENA